MPKMTLFYFTIIFFANQGYFFLSSSFKHLYTVASASEKKNSSSHLYTFFNHLSHYLFKWGVVNPLRLGAAGLLVGSHCCWTSTLYSG